MYPSEVVSNFKTCGDLALCLSRLNSNSRLAVAISREYAHNNHLIRSSQFYCFESENIYEYDLTFLIRKESPFSEVLNKFIQRAIESGLMKKWRSGSQNRVTNKYIDKTGVYLSSKSFFGMLSIWGYLIITSIVAFMFEKFVYFKINAPNSSYIWKFVEVFFDGKRHFWVENVWD